MTEALDLNRFKTEVAAGVLNIKKHTQAVDAPRKVLSGKGFSPTVLPTGSSAIPWAL